MQYPGLNLGRILVSYGEDGLPKAWVFQDEEPLKYDCPHSLRHLMHNYKLHARLQIVCFCFFFKVMFR